jgi:hypothetical protein
MKLGISWKTFLPALAFAIAVPAGAQAADYYVDQNNAGASDSNPGTVDRPWKTITKANQTLTAGDTVYVRGGTYTSSNVAPANSGTASAYITYQSYPGETVTISGRANVLYVSGKRYIRMKGINGANNCHPIEIRYSDHIIVEDGSFGPHTAPGSCSNNWAANRITNDSQYITLRGNKFFKYGATGDFGTLLEVGQEDPPNDTAYILIEDNIFYHSGHHAVGLQGRYTIFRNNRVHNESWIGGYGGRNIYSQGIGAYRNVIEGNRFGFNWLAGDSNTPSGLGTIAGDYNIIRFNKSFNNCAGGMSFTCSGGYRDCPNDNHIYNNTLYNNDRCSDGNSGQAAIIFQNAGGPGSIINNAIKNNIFTDHVDGDYRWLSVSSGSQVIANNFGNNSGDPLFVSKSGTDPFSTALPDLNLQASSPCIDAGGALTTTSSSGTNSTTMTVADANYFMDGYGLVPGDTIQLMGSTTRAKIKAVNYSTKTLTLETPMTWSSGQGVALSYSGGAPDQGAHEFQQAQTQTRPLAPTNLQIN